MDAHLFRLFANAIEPYWENCRIEKIQMPARDILTLNIFGGGKRQQLVFRFSRQEPFCFASAEKLAANSQPSAAVMRIRRYFAQKRIAGAVAQFCARKIWLLAPAPEEKPAKAVWLCIDLAKGPELHFLEPHEAPEPDSPAWPDSIGLAAALGQWRDWPVLTPILRKTLAVLPAPEQMALLEDLRAGGGDIFLYCAKNSEGRNSIQKVSAWPLPSTLRGNLEELSCADILPSLEKAGQSLVLARLHESRLNNAIAPIRRKANRLRKLLPKLDADEQKLLAMRDHERDAIAIRDNLWRVSADFHTDRLEIEESGGAKRTVSLDPRYGIRENMNRLFHDSGRAKRGLQMLAKRRQETLDELRSLEGIPLQKALEIPQSSEEGKEEEKKDADNERMATLAAMRQILPKNVAAYLSSDGYAILIGKDAKGNARLRKLASSHDIWAHVQEGTGAHVVIRRPHPGHEIPERTLDEAGCIAACKSWLCNAGSAAIMYAEMRHVKPARNGPMGKMIIDKLFCVRNVVVDQSLLARLTGNS